MHDDFYYNVNYVCLLCRIIEIAGGREVFSQSRGKVAARKPRFLTSSKSVPNDESTGDKVTSKKNTKSPNRQSVWELRSR